MLQKRVLLAFFRWLDGVWNWTYTPLKCRSVALKGKATPGVFVLNEGLMRFSLERTPRGATGTNARF